MKKWKLLILLILVILTGCSQSNGNEVEISVKKAEEILDARLLATQISENEETPAYLAVMEERNSFEILSLEENEETADAVLLVHAPDLYSIVKKIEAEGEGSEEEMFATLAQELEVAELTETEVALQFHQIDDEWQPILTTEFIDAYYGGILRLRMETFGAMAEKGGIA